MIVKCKKCGTRNELPDPPESGKLYHCGNCKTAIGVPRKTLVLPGIVTRAIPFVHPLLLAMFPILFLYSFNSAEVRVSEIVQSTVIALAFTLILLLLLKFILRDNMKAGIIVSIFVVMFFSYGYVTGTAGGSTGKYWIGVSIGWILLFGVSAYFVIKTRKNLDGLTKIVSIVAVVLILIATLQTILLRPYVGTFFSERTQSIEVNTWNTANADTYPDIYYIVMDTYASSSILQTIYDFDNSEFTDYLTAKGFYVASESYSNYPRTPQSLASSLNLEYVNYLTEEVGDTSHSLLPMYEIIRDHEVWRILESLGYTYVHFGGGWEGTRTSKRADVNINMHRMPEFSRMVLKTTLAYPFLIKLGVLDDDRLAHRNGILYLFEKMAEVPDMEEPTFVFAHILMPHGPFVFDRYGDYLTIEEMNFRGFDVNYVEQLAHTNTMLRSLIDEILSKSDTPPIIILQADEGPHMVHGEIGTAVWKNQTHYLYENMTEEQLKEKMGILNAYYLPNTDQGILYPTITPVNSFRLIFNLYFGADLDLLPDENYAYSGGFPYRFFEVTDKLNDNQQ